MKSNIEETRRSPLSSSPITLSLVVGIIILFGSIIPILFFANYSYQTPGMMGGTMMGGARGLGIMWFGPGLMGGWLSASFFLIPMISGIMVIIGAIMMSNDVGNSCISFFCIRSYRNGTCIIRIDTRNNRWSYRIK